MINFYQQVGYSGIIIFLLGFISIYMTIRGIVLVILIKKQENLDNSIIKNIVKSVSVAKENERQQLIYAHMQVKMRGVFTSMYFLKLCAAICPLLGLLGTVLGMVNVFSNLAEKAISDPTLLAGGIWQALLTTVMGLTVAIPCIIVHYFLMQSLRFLKNKIYFMARDRDE